MSKSRRFVVPRGGRERGGVAMVTVMLCSASG